MKPQHRVVAIALALMGAAFAYMSITNGSVGSVETTDTGIVKTYSKVKADASANVPIALTEGAGVEHESSHVFQALQTLPGIADATILADGSEVRVTYSSAEISEASIVSALASAGYGASSQAP